MKKYLCEICFSGFKTQEGKEFHRNRKHKIYEFDLLVFQNDKKYFFFQEAKIISKKHDRLYNLVTVSKACVKGKVVGNVFKKSRIYFSSNEIYKKLENRYLENLSLFELDNLEIYIKKLI